LLDSLHLCRTYWGETRRYYAKSKSQQIEIQSRQEACKTIDGQAKSLGRPAELSYAVKDRRRANSERRERQSQLLFPAAADARAFACVRR
jgi:hypothetical protein